MNFEDMKALRRDLHRFPETGWAEFRTTAFAAQCFEKWGYAVRYAGEYLRPGDIMGRSIDAEAEMARACAQGADPAFVKKTGGYTGLVADLDTGVPGPLLGIRFDIDCVDTNEASDESHLPAKEGFRSCNKGEMHACGHDGHTVIGLAVAEWIACHKDELKGRVRFLVQPAEEGVRGGYAMTQAGLCDDIDYLLTFHLGLQTPTGTIYGGCRGFLCTTKFDVRFRGKGAHAGGEPNEGKNALLAACSAALNLHAIAPHRDGATRINVGVLNAGEGRNVIAPSAFMKVETRGLTYDILNYVYKRAEEVIRGAAAMYDCGVEIIKQGESCTADSDEFMVSLIKEAAAEVPGVTAEGVRMMSGSDDACWMMRRVQEHGGKATYAVVGATIAAGHHNDHFDFDEQCMPLAQDVFCKAVKKLLGR